MAKKLKNRISRYPLTREEVERAVYAFYPIGFVKGRLGRWRVRWQNGKPIIYKKAEVYNASQSYASIENRNNMGSAIRLAAALNKIDSIKEIWTRANVEGRNSYTRQIKHHKKHLINNLPSVNNTITPEMHHFEVNNLVTFDSVGRINICHICAKNEILVVVLVPCDPVSPRYKEFEVIILCNSSAAAESQLNLTNEQSAVCERYNSYILFSALIRKDGESLTWSNTCVMKSEFSIEEFCNDEDVVEVFVLISLIPYPCRILRKDHAPPGRLRSAV